MNLCRAPPRPVSSAAPGPASAHAATLRLVPFPARHWLVLAGPGVQGGCPQCLHAVKAHAPSAGMQQCRNTRASANTGEVAGAVRHCGSCYIAATPATSARLVVRCHGGCRTTTGIGYVQCSRASPRPAANIVTPPAAILHWQAAGTGSGMLQARDGRLPSCCCVAGQRYHVCEPCQLERQHIHLDTLAHWHTSC
jgi:hypothetical protein